MTDQTQQLHQQLWNIANTLRGKMNEFIEVFASGMVV